MSCHYPPSVVHGYFDGELDAVHAAEFERHLETCVQCQAALEAIDSLHARLREAELYEAVSPEFRARVRASLGGATRTRVPWWSRRAVWSLAAAAAVVLVVTGFLFLQTRRENARIQASVVDAAARSLQAGHLIDVESSDSHTVKPWFEGKLDFVPPVNDFAQQGFRLVGGRLDVVDGHSAAVLVYARRKHFINLLVWRYDKDDRGFAGSGSARGFNWIMWQPGEMRFCLVSDVAPEDLRELKRLLGE